jgi:hypothetical protein
MRHSATRAKGRYLKERSLFVETPKRMFFRLVKVRRSTTRTPDWKFMRFLQSCLAVLTL